MIGQNVATFRSFEQADVFRSRHVVDACATASGDVVIYQVVENADAGGPSERLRNRLWRLDRRTGETREIAGWAHDASAPTVSPDGAFLLFLAAPSPDGARQIYRLDEDADAAAPLTDLRYGIALYTLSPDGRRIAFAARDPGLEARSGSDHVRVSRFMYRFDNLAHYLDDCGQAIYLMGAGGADPQAVTEHDGLVTALAFDQAGRRLAATVAGGRDSRRFNFFSDLLVLDEGGNASRLLRDAAVSCPFWHGDAICFSAMPGDNFSRQTQLCRIPATGGEVESRTAHLDRPVLPFLIFHNPGYSYPGRQFVDGAGRAITTIQHGGEAGIHRVTLDGEAHAESLVTGPRICKLLSLAGETLLYSVQELNQPAELWAMDLASGDAQRLTDLNARWRSEIAWPECRLVIADTASSTSVEGWLMTPAGRTGPFPTILSIHGGPHAAYGYGYYEDFQELVGMGYAVLFANPRGSTGYGDAFSTAIVGCWGNPELEDFHALLDMLVAEGLIDADRLGVTGLSGGGHLTAWLITHTDRFKAAIPEQGVYNIASFYGTSDAGITIASLEMDGHPHEVPERYWNLSPIAHAHLCRTPTLLIQGEDDIRCPMEQAEQLYTILRYHGCEAELLRLKGCYHATELVGAPGLRRARIDAIKDWFVRHMAP